MNPGSAAKDGIEESVRVNQEQLPFLSREQAPSPLLEVKAEIERVLANERQEEIEACRAQVKELEGDLRYYKPSIGNVVDAFGRGLKITFWSVVAMLVTFQLLDMRDAAYGIALGLIALFALVLMPAAEIRANIRAARRLKELKLRIQIGKEQLARLERRL